MTEDKKNMNEGMLPDEELIRMFLTEQIPEPADNGFTERVMANLPERGSQMLIYKLWTWMCIACGVFFVCYLNTLDDVKTALRMIVAKCAGNVMGALVDVCAASQSLSFSTLYISLAAVVILLMAVYRKLQKLNYL